MLDIYKNQKQLATNIKQLRVINEKTLSELSLITGLSTSYLNQLELGKRTINPLDFYKIISAYNISFAFYLTQLTNSIGIEEHWKESKQITILESTKSYSISIVGLNTIETLRFELYNESFIDFIYPFKCKGLIYSYSNELLIIKENNEYSLKLGECFSINAKDKLNFRSLSKDKIEFCITLEDYSF